MTLTPIEPELLEARLNVDAALGSVEFALSLLKSTSFELARTCWDGVCERIKPTEFTLKFAFFTVATLAVAGYGIYRGARFVNACSALRAQEARHKLQP